MSIPKQFFLKWFSALKDYPLRDLNIPARTRHDLLFVLNVKNSLYDIFDKPPGVSFSAHKPVFERFEYLVTGPPDLQITQNQHDIVSTARGYHGQVQSA